VGFRPPPVITRNVSEAAQDVAVALLTRRVGTGRTKGETEQGRETQVGLGSDRMRGPGKTFRDSLPNIPPLELT